MNLETIKKKAAKKIDSLENPESIRTPGRTWTRYPEIEPRSIEVEPSIEAEGEVEIFQGEEAVKTAGEKIFDAIKVEEDKIVATHAANLNSVIYVKAEGKAKIDILYEDDADTFAHLIVETGKNADLELTEEFRNKGLLTSINEFYLGENSTMTYGAIESSDSELTYSRRKAVLDNYASMNWLNSQFHGDLKRTKIETVLKGNNSETENIAVWYPTRNQHNDISMHVYHLGENTRCQMSSRAVVDDEARSVYEGMQKVGDRADDTSSFQDEKVLSLSDKAEIDASPKLMIEDPNVEASHAASAGNLPEKEVHYMESRGLSEEMAQRLIVKGFFEPVMDEIKMPELKKKIRAEVEKKLSEE